MAECVNMYIKFRARRVLQDYFSDHLSLRGPWISSWVKLQGLAGNSDPLIGFGCQGHGRQDSHVLDISDVVTFPDFIDEKDEVQKN